MAEVVLERRLNAPIERVFAFVTQPENLTKWWGPEGMTVPEGDLDLSRLGTWDSVMMSSEGARFKVSGVVTEISAPNKVEFTWAWHDENDARGNESSVSIDLIVDGDATQFRLTHTGLPDDESAQNHTQGWTSSLRKLEALAS
ncbi:MAG: SRPBCC domain-containing protein [Paracoccaceae bacterium]|jgi:uncharacterized protein YndB with AHSA1/START domain|nr:SRPBCC domain-containing protein [Paracoccaceae bacterium]